MSKLKPQTGPIADYLDRNPVEPKSPGGLSQFLDWTSTPQADNTQSFPDWANTPQPGLADEARDPSQAISFAKGMISGHPGLPAVGGAAVPAQIAYHGSPHDFDQFSMDRNGTGRGENNYGRGHYFAGHPEVAAEYVPENGRAYAADIPESENLLDYDKSLSQQPRAVLEKLNAAGLLTPEVRGDLDFPRHESTGKDIYGMLGADKLRAAGVSGLQYPADLGTHNFVIWDDSKIKPVAKAPNIDELLARLAALKK